MQKLWNTHINTVNKLCSKEFWSLFHVVNTEKGACADAVLKWTKKMLQSQPGVTVSLGHRWPSSRRSLVRWLTAHPRALVRDDALRPLCPPPLDINHALWKFAEEDRSLLTPRIVNQHITSYPGNTMSESLTHMRSEQRAWFGLVEIDCLREILNCTSVDNDLNTILQTITLPFQ